MRKLFNDEVGFVVSAELVLVLTIAVLGMVAGLASVQHSINAELVDLFHAFGVVDQTYSVNGLRKDTAGATKPHAQVAGFGFNDGVDDCDCKALIYDDVCGKTQTGAANDGN